MRTEAIQDFLKPLSQRPALAAFFCSVLFLSASEFPLYGIAFVPVLIVILGFFPPFSRRICLCILMTFGMRILLGGGSSGDVFQPVKLSIQNSGFVESVLERPEGVAVILQSREGKVRLSKKAPPFPAPGDSISFTAKWFPVEPPTVPGGFNTPKWLQSQNLAGFGRLENFHVLQHKWIPEEAFLHIRHALKNYFAQFLSPAEAGLLIGLLAGDRSSIPDSPRWDRSCFSDQRISRGAAFGNGPFAFESNPHAAQISPDPFGYIDAFIRSDCRRFPRRLSSRFYVHHRANRKPFSAQGG